MEGFDHVEYQISICKLLSTFTIFKQHSISLTQFDRKGTNQLTSNIEISDEDPFSPSTSLHYCCYKSWPVMAANALLVDICVPLERMLKSVVFLNISDLKQDDTSSKQSQTKGPRVRKR